MAFALPACGETAGGSDPGLFTGREVLAAFEDASNGYGFEKKGTPIADASVYAPTDSLDPAMVEPLTEALGDASILWQVFVFGGEEPPTERAAARAAAFGSQSFRDEGDGVYLGDFDTVYVPNRNVVITGPVFQGDVESETLERWREVLDGL